MDLPNIRPNWNQIFLEICEVIKNRSSCIRLQTALKALSLGYKRKIPAQAGFSVSQRPEYIPVPPQKHPFRRLPESRFRSGPHQMDRHTSSLNPHPPNKFRIGSLADRLGNSRDLDPVSIERQIIPDLTLYVLEKGFVPERLAFSHNLQSQVSRSRNFWPMQHDRVAQIQLTTFARIKAFFP